MTSLTQKDAITGENLSIAWAKAFLKCWKIRNNTLTPAVVHFDVTDDAEWNVENFQIRQALEKQLSKFRINSANQSNIETVAGTIFPEMVWERCNGDFKLLFDRYDYMWDLIEKCKDNKRGTYFRRLTNYGPPHVKKKNKVNQLEKIIEKWKKKTRNHSALQAGVFDPLQDHLTPGSPYQKFPCLQQVVFHPHGTNGCDGLSVIAFYANQLVIEKAYGNYLGLYRLGRFMAEAMDLKLTGVTCVATNLNLSLKSGKKRDTTKLKETLEGIDGVVSKDGL